MLAAYIETASTLTSFVWYSKTLLNSTLGKCKTACMSTSSCTHGNFFTNGSRCELGFEAGASKQVKCHGQCASFIKWYAPKGVKAGSVGYKKGEAGPIVDEIIMPNEDDHVNL